MSEPDGKVWMEAELNALLFAALARAQANMSNPAFDRENPHFRNKFASLAAVRDAIVPALAAQGIAVTQNLTTNESGVFCETLLLHCEGGMMRLGPLFLPATKVDAQGLAAASTYARRYALMAVACVVGDTDDDAEGAVSHEPDWPFFDKVMAALMSGMESGDDLKVLETWDGLNTDQMRTVYANLSRWIPGKVTAWKEQHAETIKRVRQEIALQGEPAVNTVGAGSGRTPKR